MGVISQNNVIGGKDKEKEIKISGPPNSKCYGVSKQKNGAGEDVPDPGQRRKRPIFTKQKKIIGAPFKPGTGTTKPN